MRSETLDLRAAAAYRGTFAPSAAEPVPGGELPPGWEGLTFTEAKQRDPELHASWLGSEEVAPPGGESFAEVGRRIETELKHLLAEYPGRTVVVVSHVTPIKVMLRLALQCGPSILYRLHLDLAGISIVDLYPDGGASVRLVNDVSHNPALG